jgi:anti-sigma B factor antagonist
MGADATGLPPIFSVRSDRRNGVARVALQGELDLSTAPELDDHLSSLEQAGLKALILDLRDIAFIDSTGLRALIRAWEGAQNDGGRLALVGASKAVRHLVELTRTEQILDEPEGMRLLELFTQSDRGPRPSSGADGG